MNYKISIPSSGQYVLCKVHEVVTVELSRQFIIDTHRLGCERNIMRFLFDVRGHQNIEEPHKIYKFTHEDMGVLKLDKTARVAILVSPDDRSHDFVETVNLNAGHNIKVFREKKDAISWLS